MVPLAVAYRCVKFLKAQEAISASPPNDGMVFAFGLLATIPFVGLAFLAILLFQM